MRKLDTVGIISIEATEFFQVAFEDSVDDTLNKISEVIMKNIKLSHLAFEVEINGETHECNTLNEVKEILEIYFEN